MISFLNNKVTKSLNMYADVHANEYVNTKKSQKGTQYRLLCIIFGKGEEMTVLCCSIVPLVIVGLCYFYNLKNHKMFF